MRGDLQRVREWANEKVVAGHEPPWAWYQYMKLVEACDAILSGIAATSQEGLLLPEGHPGKHLRLVGDSDPQDTAPRHPESTPVQLPM